MPRPSSPVAARLERLARDLRRSRPLAWYKPGRRVPVNDRMAATGPAASRSPVRWSYTLTAAPGRSFAPGFRPALSPGRMLRMGVFEGRYLNDCSREFPREWFVDAMRRGRLSPGAANVACNCFGVKSRLSLREWRRRGWVPVAPGDRDARGWFQWYCRYWLGRRDPAVDEIQIARWRAFSRHRGQILASYRRGARPRTLAERRRHRPAQRQALLQWAYWPWV